MRSRAILIAALVFAWEHAKQIAVQTRIDEQGRKIYELSGSVFFASISLFQTLFTPNDDPEDVIIEFRNAKVMMLTSASVVTGSQV